MEAEVSFLLGLINCRRSRRGDWDSSIIEASHLHLSVPACLERASYMSEASTLTITVNLGGPALPDLHDLFFFLPSMCNTENGVYCYALADASEVRENAATSVVALLNDKLVVASSFLALQLVHMIDQTVQAAATTIDTADVTRKLLSRVRTRLASHPDACDVLLCLLATAATSPNRLSPFPPMFKSEAKDDLGTLIAEEDFPLSLALADLDVRFVGEVIASPDPWFDRAAAEHGSTMCYHGSKMVHFHSILQNGLQVMSGTRHMSSGNVFGDGIYFAQSPQVAMNFAFGTPCQQWSQSRVMSKNAICVAVCQVLKDPAVLKTLPASQADGTYYVLSDHRHVRIKYLLVLSPKAVARTSAWDVVFGSPWEIVMSVFWFAVAYLVWSVADAT
ncbi:hypothetical protein ACHHYP_01105 [Achlya hypogyna]|uniref:PARP catalytic domain-containing protein n=1 Tax=Achlya hypogyna TaxID=1202772 RepID=A0A1V9Z9G6_ACHHY|nr:hypothetical protein ACHHYP_01105 [Achlya hypogyna]